LGNILGAIFYFTAAILLFLVTGLSWGVGSSKKADDFAIPNPSRKIAQKYLIYIKIMSILAVLVALYM